MNITRSTAQTLKNSLQGTGSDLHRGLTANLFECVEVSRGTPHLETEQEAAEWLDTTYSKL